METADPPRPAAPPTLSRYRSVRRKVAAAADPPPPMPSAGLHRSKTTAGATRPPTATRPPPPTRASITATTTTTRPPLSRASTTAAIPTVPLVMMAKTTPAPPPHRKEKEKEDDTKQHQSKFRNLLKLNTKDAGDKARERAEDPKKRDGSQTAPPTTSSGRNKLSRKDTVRMAAEAKLEGRAVPPVPPVPVQSPKAEMPKKKTDEPTFDVTVHFSKGEQSPVPITNSTSASMLLSDVRPGHERVLLECWPSLGLQRQVRPFEHVSDVLSTWDDGSSAHVKVAKEIWNSSVAMPSSFPREEPASGEAIFYYYVTADRKWQKRTLSLSNGSLRIIKKDRPQDKEVVQNITLDFFDIYTFQEVFKPWKGLKSPTKLVFALKSQHKQSLFGKNSVFAHYFAVDNEEYFTHWFAMIRDAKSRLIAEKKGIAPWLNEPEDKPDSEGDKSATSPDSPTKNRNFPQPLISQQELAQPPPTASDLQRSKSLGRAKSTRRPGGSNRAVSATAPKMPEPFSASGLLGGDYEEKRRLAAQAANEYNGPAFVGGGLLGNDYEEKKRLAMQSMHEHSGPAFVGGGLLGSDYEEKRRQAQLQFKQDRNKDPFSPHQHRPPPSSYRDPSPHGHGLTRHQTAPAGGSIASNSSSHPGSRPGTGNKPVQQSGPTTLLDFSGEEIVPALPQHRRVRGHTLPEKEIASVGGLINFASNMRPDADLYIPPVPQDIHHHRGRDQRAIAIGDPFTGTGLLARDFPSSGAPRGKGIKTSRDAIGRNGEIHPLLPQTERSVFAKGSLLEKQDLASPKQGPVIDRDHEVGDSDSD